MNPAAVALLVAALVPAAPRPAQKLYVANSGGTDLHVIDLATNRVVRRVEVGPQPLHPPLRVVQARDGNDEGGISQPQFLADAVPIG